MRIFLYFVYFIIFAISDIYASDVAPKEQENHLFRSEIDNIYSFNIALPAPKYNGISLEDAIKERRSKRDYTGDSITMTQLSQILFAAQGITYSDKKGHKRAAPSAGALYPMTIYIVVNNIDGITPGIYKYNPKKNNLLCLRQGSFKNKMSAICLNKKAVYTSACNIIMVASPAKIIARFGKDAANCVYMEAGHISQNIYLQVTSLKLGTVSIGGFSKKAMGDLLGITNIATEIPIYMQPIGIPK